MQPEAPTGGKAAAAGSVTAVAETSATVSGAAATAVDAELIRRIRAGRRQLLARAVGLHRHRALRIVDATAGLGRDAIVLAALGAQVQMLERSPEVHALLAARLQTLPDTITARLTLALADASEWLPRHGLCDVVYLDPMYTASGKTALPRAHAQQLRALAGSDEDADELLAPARAAARLRVVVKRAPRAPALAGLPPHQSLRGNKVRFDLYLPDRVR